MKDKKILKNNIITEIIKPKYNKGDNFSLSGFNIPSYSSSTYSNIQEEKRLQWLTQLQMEMITNTQINEENHHTNINGQEGGYILNDILFEKIKLINKKIINDFLVKCPKYSFEEIAKKIYNNFINQVKVIFDSSNLNKNIELHQLYFNEDKLLKIKISNEVILYNVIDKKDANNNEITIIKEKKLLIGARNEFPDFAVYYNGLPFIVIEMKSTMVNGDNGRLAAANDYHTKGSYHNFLGCIGTNGNSTFISCSPNLLDPYIWENYPDLEGYVNYYEKNDKNGLFDIINELLSSRKNMLFYFESCTMISECGNYLKNARIQQYFTAKQVYEKMVSPNNTNGFKNHFKHHTRTGKSYTFKIIAKLALRKVNVKYKKVIFFTHDVSSVMPSVSKEFNNINLQTEGLIEIKDKKDYNKKLSSNNMSGLYIANMQKITKDSNVIDNSDGVLIFIDEVHTHQSSTDGTIKKNTMADFRKVHFPNATVISATASPLVKEEVVNGKTTYRNITEELHGKCINKVTPSDALRLNLVTRLYFSKETFQSDKINQFKNEFDKKDKDESKIIKEKIKDNIDNIIENALIKYQERREIIDSVLENYNVVKVTEDNYSKVSKLNPFNEDKEIKEFEQMEELLNCLQLAIDEAIGVLKSNAKSIFNQKLWESTLEEKIEEIVIPEVLSQRIECGDIFTPKFFYIVDKRNNKNNDTNGEKMLNVVKKLIQIYLDNNDNVDSLEFNLINNVYKGVRFGFDNSEENPESNFNGDLEGKSNITKLFEVDKLEKDKSGEFKNKKVKNPCDVLILVRKKLMGYDNANLTTVFLDKEIDESNIKEMLQLATRGTTKRKGKKIGYIKDLTFSQRNPDTYKKAFAIYDEKEGVKDFLFDEEEIIKSIGKIKETKEDLVDLMLEQDISKDITENNIFDYLEEITEHIKVEYWNWKNKKERKENASFIENYIELIDKLTRSFKSLISPSFILEKKNKEELLKEVLCLFEINSYLLTDIKDKNANIYKKRYTNDEIVDILEQTFTTFGGVSAFIEKLNLKYKNGQEVKIPNKYIIKDKKKALSSVLGKMKNDLSHINNELAGRIGEALDEISMNIDTNNGDIEKHKEKVEKLEKEIEDFKKKEQNEINVKFNGDRNLFVINETLLPLFGNSNSDLLLEFSKALDFKIKKERNNIVNLKKIETIKTLANENCFTGALSDCDIDKNYDRWKILYDTIFNSEIGVFKIENEKLEKDIDNGFEFEYLDSSNIIFIILREYI